MSLLIFDIRMLLILLQYKAINKYNSLTIAIKLKFHGVYFKSTKITQCCNQPRFYSIHSCYITA